VLNAKDTADNQPSRKTHLQNTLGNENTCDNQPNESAHSPSVPNYDLLLLKDNRKDSICRPTRARHSLAKYSLEELETFQG
jgi:hypothetical protein